MILIWFDYLYANKIFCTLWIESNQTVNVYLCNLHISVQSYQIRLSRTEYHKNNLEMIILNLKGNVDVGLLYVMIFNECGSIQFWTSLTVAFLTDFPDIHNLYSWSNIQFNTELYGTSYCNKGMLQIFSFKLNNYMKLFKTVCTYSISILFFYNCWDLGI